MKKRLLSVLCIVLAVTMLALTGCSSEKTPGTTGGSDSATSGTGDVSTPAKDTLVYAINGDISNLDPVTLTDGASATVWHQIYDTLFQYDENNNPVPHLVESYAFNDDGTELTLNLIKGVKFHNGDELTANDVAFTLDYIYNNPTLTTTLTNYASTEVVDDYTCKIHYTAAFGAALAQLTSYSTNIISKAHFEKVGIEGYQTEPIGTGPYKFVSRTPGEKIELVANDDYFLGAPSIKNVTIRVITDPTAAAMALQSGDVDVVQTPSVDQRDTLMAANGITWEETMSSTTVFLMINNKDPQLSNEKVRQAIWYAIDKDLLVEGALEGLGQPLETLAPGAVASAYDPDFKGYGYDVEKAKSLLAEAGYPDGITITITTMLGSDTYQKPTLILQDMLKEAGINLVLDEYERAAWISKVGSGDYAMTVMTWGVPSLDGEFYTRLLISGSYLQINSAELDNLLAAQQVEMDAAKRKAIFGEINTLIRDHANLVPLYAGYNYLAYNSALKGISVNAASEYFIYNMSW